MHGSEVLPARKTEPEQELNTTFAFKKSHGLGKELTGAQEVAVEGSAKGWDRAIERC